MTEAEKSADQSLHHAWTELGRRLRTARTASGLGLREAAESAGISRSRLSAIETGRDGRGRPSRTSAENILKLAEMYAVDANEMLRLVGYDPSRHNRAQIGRASISERAIARKLGLLSERQRTAISELIDSMIDPSYHAAGEVPGDDETAIYRHTITVEDVPVHEPSAADRTVQQQDQPQPPGGR